MRKTVLILIITLLAVYGTLSIVSSNDDYAAERLFFKATKINRKIIANPDVVPPVMLTSVENTLKKILDKYPKSKIVKAAHLGLAEFYFKNKKYDRTLSTADEIIDTYGQDKTILSKAYFLKGATYERQNLWEEALKEYIILRDKFTETPLGLGVPLYIGDYYTGKERYAKADGAYNEASLFYKRIERENRGEAFGYTAANLLFQTYVRMQKYEQAGEVVEDTVNNYPKLLVFTQQLPKIELIFIKTLNKPEKAIEIYNNIKEKTDESGLIKFIDEKIKGLEAQK